MRADASRLPLARPRVWSAASRRAIFALSWRGARASAPEARPRRCAPRASDSHRSASSRRRRRRPPPTSAARRPSTPPGHCSHRRVEDQHALERASGVRRSRVCEWSVRRSDRMPTRKRQHGGGPQARGWGPPALTHSVQQAAVASHAVGSKPWCEVVVSLAYVSLKARAEPRERPARRSDRGRGPRPARRAAGPWAVCTPCASGPDGPDVTAI